MKPVVDQVGGSAVSPVIVHDDDSKFAKQLKSLGLHVYSDDDILQLTGQFQKLEFVREGGFGEVFVGTFARQKIALKKVKGLSNISCSETGHPKKGSCLFMHWNFTLIYISWLASL